MLQALRDGRLSELEKYEDIMPMDIADYLKHHESKIDLRESIQKKKEQMAEKQKEQKTSLIEKVVLTLINLNIEPSLAEKCTVKAINELPGSSEAEITGRALQILTEKKEKKKTNRDTPKKNELQLIIDKGKKNQKSAYESLKEAGNIKSPMDDFAIWRQWDARLLSFTLDEQVDGSKEDFDLVQMNQLRHEYTSVPKVKRIKRGSSKQRLEEDENTKRHYGNNDPIRSTAETGG